METAVFIARIIGPSYLICAAGMFFSRKAYQRVMEDFCKNAALVFYGGLIALVIGLVVLLNHNVWRPDWRVIITIFGWGGVIKGAWLIVFPDTLPKFMQVYQKNTLLLAVHAILAFLLGLIFTYFGYLAR